MTEPVFADRVEEYSMTTGTGPIGLTGATPGHRVFASVAQPGQSFFYTIDNADDNGTDWEVGLGTLGETGMIERAPTASSAGGAPVDFGQGRKRIALTLSSDYLDRVQTDAGLTLRGPQIEANGNGSFVALDVRPDDPRDNSAGGDDAVSTRLIVNNNQFAQGPTEQANYYNTVFGLGSNMNTAFLPENPDIASGSFRIESKFYQGGKFLSEYHISHFSKGSGNELRMFSAVVPHDEIDWASHSYTRYAAGNHIFDDGDKQARIQFDFRPGRNVILHSDDGSGHPTALFATNDRPTARQMNAGGSAYLTLPHINAFDNLAITQPVYAVCAVGSNPSGARAAFAMNVTAGQADDSAIAIACPTLASGQFFAQTINGSIGGRLTQQVYNSGAGSACIDLQVLNGAGNDCQLSFSNVGGGTAWTIGYDNSDGDKVKIEASYRSVGSASALFVEFDPVRGISNFAKPIRLPGRSVGGLPGAGEAGAGAMAYCTDADGGAVPVFSDGTAWRRMTDRAVVAA